MAINLKKTTPHPWRPDGVQLRGPAGGVVAVCLSQGLGGGQCAFENAALVAEAVNVAGECDCTPRRMKDRLDRAQIDLRCAWGGLDILRPAAAEAARLLRTGQAAPALLALERALDLTGVPYRNADGTAVPEN